MQIEIFQLNHASLLIVMGDVRLLTDPWFEGACFDDGWGLRWQSPNAYGLAATATHLWISHPHSDHLHHATLKHLHALNPHIKVLANQSYNYDLRGTLQAIGFTQIQTVAERTLLSLGDGCTIERIGAGAIDSLLVLRWQGITLLNMNDCVLQPHALHHIAKKVGAIDLLLCNFNHAGKLLHYPAKPPEEIKQSLKQHYRQQAEILQPRCTLPFASFHRYLSPLSATQNASLLEPTELDAHGQNVCIYPGQKAIIHFDAHNVNAEVNGELPTAMPEPTAAPYADGKLVDAARDFERKLARALGPLRLILPTLYVRIIETQEVLTVKRGRVTFNSSQPADIEAHLPHVALWFGAPYGTDAFVVGAHFTILRPCIGRLKFFISILLLIEAKITPHAVLSPRFWSFIFHRKHELMAALLSWRVSSSYQ